LRNIHISTDYGSFTFYVDVFLPDLTVFMINMAGVLQYETATACLSRAPEFLNIKQ
jgi:hypothetical protein